MLFSRATCLLIVVVGAICLTKTADARPSVDKSYSYPLRHYSNPRNCDLCLPGWGLVRMCNATHLTLCTPCTDDTYSSLRSHLNPCRPCSKCGDGLYEEHKCRPDRDTRCGWCHASKGIFTDDYIRKCATDDYSNDSPADSQESFAINKAQEENRRNEHNVGVPDDGDRRHEFWDFDKSARGPLDITDEERIVIKPSYHDYEVDRQSAVYRQYRQKAYILLGFAAMLVLIAVAFFVWLVRECQRPTHRVIPGRQKLYSHLTELDNEIIRQCANKLRRDGKLRSISESSAENEDYWEEPMRITDNPMEHYIAYRSTEQLLQPKAKC